MLKDDIEDVNKAAELLERLELLKIEMNQTTDRATCVKYQNNSLRKFKWCTVPKTATHSNEECFNQKNRNTSKQERNLVLHERHSSISQLEMVGIINDTKVNCTLDTGAKRNYINRKVAEKIKLQPIPINEMTVQVADGSIQKVLKKYEVTLQFENIPHMNLPTVLLELDKLPVDINLGMEWLSNNRVIIDLNENQLTLNKKIISLNETENGDYSGNEDQIADRINLCMEKQIVLDRIVNLRKTADMVGKIESHVHEINLKSDNYISKRLYPLLFKLLEATKLEISRLLKLEIIKPSCSRFASPAFPLVKKNGEIRLVVDYRDLNKISHIDPYPLPSIQDTMLKLHGSSIFRQLDMNNGYYQIRVAEKDVGKTAFILPFGHYEFLRMPFGLTNAPRTFQKAMNHLLGEFDFVKIFLDDVLVHSSNESDHIKHLNLVLDVIERNGVGINFGKSSFFNTQVEYLGHKISKDGIKADVTKIEKIELLNRKPNSMKELRRIIGVINWFRPYVPNLSTNIASITDKTKTGELKKWSEVDSQILKNVIEEIKSNNILQFPYFDQQFELWVDASDRGIGSILKQRPNIVGVYSSKYKGSEINYTVCEKEMLAVYKSLKYFKNIIYNAEIIIKTDNKNNTFSHNKGNRINRWSLELTEFNYKLEHIAGTENKAADFFSRNLIILDENETLTNKIKDIIGPNHTRDKKKIVIEDKHTEEFLNIIHRELGHMGTKRLRETVSTYYKVPGIDEKAKRIVKECMDCQRNKHFNSNQGRLAGYIHAEYPVQKVGMDIYGPIEKGIIKKNNQDGVAYIISIVDIFSRITMFIECVIIRGRDIVTILKDNWIANYGRPAIIITDQGRQFLSDEYIKFCNENDIKRITTTAYNPTANSVVERVHRTLGNMIRIYKNDSNLQRFLKKAENNINLGYHTGIKCSPVDLIKKRNPINIENYVKEINCDINAALQKAEKMKSLQKRNMKRRDVNLRIGDMVMIRKGQRKNKFDLIWEGPYEIRGLKHEDNQCLVNFNNSYSEGINIKRVRRP